MYQTIQFPLMDKYFEYIKKVESNPIRWFIYRLKWDLELVVWNWCTDVDDNRDILDCVNGIVLGELKHVPLKIRFLAWFTNNNLYEVRYQGKSYAHYAHWKCERGEEATIDPVLNHEVKSSYVK